MEKLTEEQLWHLIENANWSTDHDYERISKEYSKLTNSEFEQLDKFVLDKCGELADKYNKDWLGYPGIDVSDDGWSDLRAEVVGRGKEFYENITVKKLQEMADTNDFHENFQYCLQRN